MIINGEADIKTCSVGQTYAMEILPGNTTDVNVDKKGVTHRVLTQVIDIKEFCQATLVDPGPLAWQCLRDTRATFDRYRFLLTQG